MQTKILEARPNAPITVISIWFDMVKTDSRKGLSPDLLDDPRVVRLWDPERRVGKWYAKALTKHYDPKQKYSDVEWDAWFLYGPEATWDQAARPVTWGRPVVDTFDQLEQGVGKLLALPPNTQTRRQRP